jgi:hypothetical protein
MTSTNLFFEPDDFARRRFRTAVSLHGHTLHSRERLDFVYRLAKQFGPLRVALERGEARYRAIHGLPLDLSRAWWTPPLAPHDAWLLETSRIENHFGWNAQVSLTDHDDIEGPTALRVLEECRDTPVSVEWTVPYAHTFLHLGIHNLDANRARQTMRDLAAFTARPSARLKSLLQYVAADPATLVVFNHPHWDEKGIGEETHRALARQFTETHGEFIHAFELNGLRPWKENRTVFDLAKRFEKPLISGGDRHALEPNALLNLSNAGTFAEFVDEIRDGYSDVLITKQYRDAFAVRIVQSIEDILGQHDNHALGWRHWSERVFYECQDGVTRSLAELWGKGEPLAVRLFVGGIGLLRHPHFKQALRLAFARREEVVS